MDTLTLIVLFTFMKAIFPWAGPLWLISLAKAFRRWTVVVLARTGPPSVRKIATTVYTIVSCPVLRIFDFDLGATDQSPL